MSDDICTDCDDATCGVCLVARDIAEDRAEHVRRDES